MQPKPKLYAATQNGIQKIGAEKSKTIFHKLLNFLSLLRMVYTIILTSSWSKTKASSSYPQCVPSCWLTGSLASITECLTLSSLSAVFNLQWEEHYPRKFCHTCLIFWLIVIFKFLPGFIVESSLLCVILVVLLP